MLILCSIELKVVCNWVDCFCLRLIGVIFRSCKRILWGFASSHIPFAFLIFAPFCSLISANSSTESLSPTNSENGDNDNINQISPTSNFAKSAHSSSLGRDSVPTLRNHSPLSPSFTLPSNVIESHQIEACPNLPAHLKVEIVVKKFGGGSGQAAVSVIQLSSSACEPITITNKWIRVSQKKGKSSSLKAPLLPKVTIVEPVTSPKILGSPSVTDAPNSSSPALHKDVIFLAQPTQGVNDEVPVNEDPLNAMEEDVLEDPKDNLYKDSQDFQVDKEDMVDTFLNLDPIQDLEMSSESFKKQKEEFGFWNNNNCHASILAKESRTIHLLVHDTANSKILLFPEFMGLHNHGTKMLFGTNFFG
ncbi:hypothetical protein Cgig2_018372 [Carnegiea gigantea]|uniref:Uncharacterized protein n=1 Tax=Carnegiea gigantea TaxID=171969 RepID=A0A9Q1JUH5_9CARY|nr:hypothetical protein Cgig2_018372 [Carnegiea gigantea]